MTDTEEYIDLSGVTTDTPRACVVREVMHGLQCKGVEINGYHTHGLSQIDAVEPGSGFFKKLFSEVKISPSCCPKVLIIGQDEHFDLKDVGKYHKVLFGTASTQEGEKDTKNFQPGSFIEGNSKITSKSGWLVIASI